MYSQQLIVLKPPKTGSTMGEWTKPGSSKEETGENPDLCMACGKLLVPPVTRCPGGHGVCYICLHRGSDICSCGEAFPREPAAGNLPPDMRFSCTNSVRGCKEKLPMNGLEQHEATCPYNLQGSSTQCHIL